MRGDYLTGKFVPEVKRDNILFEEFAEEWFSLHAKTNLIGEYRSKLDMIKRHFSSKRLRDITSKHIEEYKASLVDQVKPSSINRYLTIVKSIFSKAVEWGRITVSPASKVKKLREDNQRTRYLTEEEIKRLYFSSSPKVAEFLTLALNTGMRRSNLVNLQWEDIDFKNGVIHVLKTKSGKGYEIPLNNDIRRVLEKKFHSNSTGNVINSVNLRKEFEAVVKNSGISDFKLHDLRHTFASYLAMKGVDLYTISQLLGHSDIKMTQRYAHLSPNHKMLAINMLNFSEKIGGQSVDSGQRIPSVKQHLTSPS
ncbi:MAG: tyrosine-type recombinase/integrase [Elusimicrobiota bacterium]